MQHQHADINFMGGSNAELQDLTSRLVDKAKAYGTEISTEKSKIVTISKNNISADISMNDQKLEEITIFKTLGAHLSKDGTHSTHQGHLSNGSDGRDW